MRGRRKYVSGTGSSHTVCQMPVVRVYMQPTFSKMRDCLPEGMARS